MFISKDKKYVLTLFNIDILPGFKKNNLIFTIKNALLFEQESHQIVLSIVPYIQSIDLW